MTDMCNVQSNVNRFTGRVFGLRLNEHRKDCECNTKNIFSRSERKQSLTEINKIAITDHMNCKNYVIGCEGSHIVDREGGGYTNQTDKGSDSH